MKLTVFVALNAPLFWLRYKSVQTITRDKSHFKFSKPQSQRKVIGVNNWIFNQGDRTAGNQTIGIKI